MSSSSYETCCLLSPVGFFSQSLTIPSIPENVTLAQVATISQQGFACQDVVLAYIRIGVAVDGNKYVVTQAECHCND